MDAAPAARTAGPDPGRALRLAPHAVVLRRSSTELQVGVGPSVVVPDTHAALLAGLARGTQPASLLRTAAQRGLRPGAVTDLIGALEAAHLLQPAPPLASRAVRVVGTGPLAVRTASDLADVGFGTVYLAALPPHALLPDDGPPPRNRRRPVDAPDPGELASATLSAAHPATRVRRTRHFAKPEGDAVALTVVVADGPEPDRLVPDVLREHGAVHLLVRSSGDEAVVGPLVVPGVTSCVRCTDLAQRDADPRWPWLLEQLVRLRVEPSATLAAWAGVTAAVQALAYLTRGRAETLGHTLELGSAEPTLRLRAWPAHPECPCRWDDPEHDPEHDPGHDTRADGVRGRA
ncbi:hypothetical protein [Microlunatus flavus]|uniref:Bacteriocin biosynthesis cyclodehydratase domain-containing protein n=1 Tax=Microlunatus flavus TaxID=1036181 RepID=A0A1H9I1H4_9ACTN|nr:hypothetical protein [Microlunatus flavus]SEQ68449.1 hypothetical protein SAMN05421756_10539 [Microlunatus flavus]